MLPSLTALSKRFQTGAVNFSRIAPNVDKTTTKRQQLFNEDKAMELLKEDIKKRLEPCNLVINQKAEEKINSITERYVKAMIWNIDERFPCNVLNILDAFSIFNLENVPTNQSSSEFSIYGCSDVEILSKHFF